MDAAGATRTVAVVTDRSEGRRHEKGWPATSARPETLFAQFRGAHLPTRVERAVFAVLAVSLDRVWTVTVVARDARVSDHEADQALRRFSAAGIIERFEEPSQPRRYRWRPEMAYMKCTRQRCQAAPTNTAAMACLSPRW